MPTRRIRCAPWADGTAAAAPAAGYLISDRKLRMLAPRLNDAPGPLRVRAQRLSGDAKQVLYAFAVSDGFGRVLADGR